MQQIGRCARDGGSGRARLFVNNTDLANSNLKPCMRSFINAKSCRREILLAEFGYKPDSTSYESNVCCDVCNPVVPEAEMPFDFQYKDELKFSLDFYFSLENGICPASCLTNDLINIICNDPIKYSDEVELKNCYPFLNDNHVSVICQLVSDHLV